MNNISTDFRKNTDVLIPIIPIMGLALLETDIFICLTTRYLKAYESFNFMENSSDMFPF